MAVRAILVDAALDVVEGAEDVSHLVAEGVVAPRAAELGQGEGEDLVVAVGDAAVVEVGRQQDGDVSGAKDLLNVA